MKKKGVTLKEMSEQKLYVPYIPLMVTDMKDVVFATKEDLDKIRCNAYKYLI